MLCVLDFFIESYSELKGLTLSVNSYYEYIAQESYKNSSISAKIFTDFSRRFIFLNAQNHSFIALVMGFGIKFQPWRERENNRSCSGGTSDDHRSITQFAQCPLLGDIKSHWLTYKSPLNVVMGLRLTYNPFYAIQPI